ncbi:MAG: metal ABC transporter substrate-binding protein [Solobacterium sp.]|nr:metal ABC transporter substrate-binding protein [Solobacterium sp.]
MRKRITAVLLCILMVASGGCTSAASAAPDTSKIRIVATIFPVYDWIRELTAGSEDVEIRLLMNKGTDLHSYQPTADDMIALENCDLFVYVGGESDAWTADALKNVRKEHTDLSLMEKLDSLVNEEVVEGMEGEEEDAYDEHIWLSLRNAEKCCTMITDALKEIDPQNAQLYSSNHDAYTEKLSSLDDEFEKTVSASARDTLVFADRFPFRYLCEDYGLDYYAAFPGCSAESEASFETVRFLAEKLDELDLHRVIITESSDGRIAGTIIDNTAAKDAEILKLHSMQSVTEEKIAEGTTYLSCMEEDLEVLKEALHE